METAVVLLLLTLSAIIATSIASYVIIKRRAEEERLRNEAEEALRRAEEEHRCREAEMIQRKAEQERLRYETEEAQRKTEEERLRCEAEETQRRAEEECLRCEIEEVQRKIEEERQSQGVEEAQPKPEKTDRRSVEDHGGRPRDSTTESKEHVGRVSLLRQTRPEIVCWQRERRWILAVEVPEDLWEKPELAVHQNTLPLAQDEREGYWRLNNICGQVTVHWKEDETPQETKITLSEENYLLFKLSGVDQKQGPRVKSPSSGSYLVVVPQSWERDEKLSGLPSVSAEPVSVEGFQGHFFDLEKGGDRRIAFRTLEGNSILIESKAVWFELIGNQLSDASEGIGPLFGKSPPQIRALRDGSWTEIGTIVVGEEGSKKKRWRIPFGPIPERQEQVLSPETAPNKDGWYFIRLYDLNNELVESLDFRLVYALREIKVPQPSPFPTEGEHGPVCVEFIHESDFAIQPTDNLARSIQIESKNNKTMLIVPPEPIYDETRWRIGSKSKPQIQITILVERLWWAVEEEGILPLEWKDKLLSLTCDDFAATSKKALWLKLPRRRWTDKVLVGFGQSRARPYAVKVTEKEIAIPLRDFGDCQEMRDRDRDQFFDVWTKCKSEIVEGIVAIIPASKGPILCLGRGKKERAMATAVLRKGTGTITVNGQPIEDYFEKAPIRAKHFLQRILELSYVRKELAQMEVSIEVTGSNQRTVQQVKASAHALARALMMYEPHMRSSLMGEGFGRHPMREAIR